jgi:hypothetical protein
MRPTKSSNLAVRARAIKVGTLRRRGPGNGPRNPTRSVTQAAKGCSNSEIEAAADVVTSRLMDQMAAADPGVLNLVESQ